MVRQRKMPITTAIRIATETIRQMGNGAEVYCNGVCIAELHDARWSELSPREWVKRERAKLAIALVYGIKSLEQFSACGIKVETTGSLSEVVERYIAYFERI